ncbi:S-adenosyl-L-methionine-dependent methyltransferase [Leucogyrophana mollusca]|uniref:S-adenosyl-L-methionine-dependent methyltransferase n=1 Tax=Leucogyrophana mollusca TaxID=85980 RepID=A0ACB8AWZ3_9AGAM|nr:S-adenosyl-L-methionine-dependent methyltransferase [Leucogyrophana mollusca]
MSGKAHLQSLLALINSAANEAILEYEKAGEDVPTIHSATLHPKDSANDSLVLKKAVRLLEGACQQLCASLAPPQHTVINFAQSYDGACVRVAIRADITSILANHPEGLHVRHLSSIVKIDEGKLARILRLLATKGCYREVKTDVFANNRLSLKLDSSEDIAILTSMHTEVVSKGAAVLYECLTDPTTAFSDDPAHAPVMYALKDAGVSGTLFDLMQSDPQTRERYHRAMIGLGSVMGSLSVLDHFPWGEFTSVCDLGSGIGAFSRPLAIKYPHLKITCHDIAEVLVQAHEVWDRDAPEAIARHNIDLLPLDFLTESPVAGLDVYYLRNIIHDWPDAEAVSILRNVRRAMTPQSRVLIQDYVLKYTSGEEVIAQTLLDVHEAPEPLLPNYGAGNMRMYESDITMMLAHNARERTVDECVKLGEKAGLYLVKMWDLAESAVLEFRLAPASV